MEGVCRSVCVCNEDDLEVCLHVSIQSIEVSSH